MSKSRDPTKPGFQASLSNPFNNREIGENHFESFQSDACGTYRKTKPPWDRALDAVYHKNIQGQSTGDGETTFSGALVQFFKDHQRNRARQGYFLLPDSVRLRICRLLLTSKGQGNPLRLNLASFDQDCWRSEDLQSPRETLQPLQPYFEASFNFRADILLTFLLDVPLHVTFSPYVGPKISPLATTWLNKYGVYAQNIAVEVDMTRLRCGPSIYAVDLLPGVDRIETLLRDFVDSQLRRDPSRPLQSLILLCRRFYGQRDQNTSANSMAGRSNEASDCSQLSQRSEPVPTTTKTGAFSPTFERPQTTSPIRLFKCHSAPENPVHSLIQEYEDVSDSICSNEAGDKSPTSPYFVIPRADYCPHSYLTMCNQLLRLRGRIDSIRMCGFSEPYTHHFIETLFQPDGANIERHAYRVAPSTVWPRLGGHQAYVDFGDGQIILDDHDTSISANAKVALAPWEGCVQLPPPVLDTDGEASLPPVVGSLLALRGRAWSTDTDSSIQEVKSEGRRELVETGKDKRGIMKMFSMSSKAKGKGK